MTDTAAGLMSEFDKMPFVLGRGPYGFMARAISMPARKMEILSAAASAIFLVLGVLVPCSAVAESLDKEWTRQRAAMVRVIERYASVTPKAAGPKGIARPVLRAMSEVPRHLFVPETLRPAAYDDRPLPIGYGQTISQPFIVALMTHLLKVDKSSVVLEIGTGSGYQAAVLSPLVKKACSIEIIPALGRSAAKRLKSLGYVNVETKIGDGYFGWPECGPFDGIIVTAAAGHVPPPLVKQLKPGGRMVIPVGGVFGPQFLTIVEKTAASQIKTRQLIPVRFVPLTRRSR